MVLDVVFYSTSGYPTLWDQGWVGWRCAQCGYNHWLCHICGPTSHSQVLFHYKSIHSTSIHRCITFVAIVLCYKIIIYHILSVIKKIYLRYCFCAKAADIVAIYMFARPKNLYLTLIHLVIMQPFCLQVVGNYATVLATVMSTSGGYQLKHVNIIWSIWFIWSFFYIYLFPHHVSFIIFILYTKPESTTSNQICISHNPEYNIHYGYSLDIW
jgi:hypothetical protein